MNESDQAVYCTAPWQGVTITEDGHVKTCCEGSTSLGNLNDSSIEKIMRSDLLYKIKEDLQQNIFNYNCTQCANHESNGNYANTRQYYLKYHPIASTYKNNLSVVDIRWNNKCNISCQYCSPGQSSTWEEKLKIVKSSTNKPYQDNLLEWVVDQSADLKEILLAGGEPMLMKQNYKLFKIAPDNCRFSIVTNCSYDLASLPCIPDLLKRPANNIIWTISAENTHDQFEYVRQGAKWDQLVKNIEFLVEHWPNTIGLNMVYSIFSATQLDQTYKTFSNLGVHKATLLYLVENRHLAVDRMPQAIRDVCKHTIDQLIDFHHTQFGIDKDFYPINGINQIRSGLALPSGNNIITKKEFYQQIQWHDSWAVKKFSDLWPNVIDLAEKYL